MNLIGIAGRAGAGKSTAASVLMKEFGFVEVALADQIKRICKEVFDFSDEQLWGPSESRNKPDIRYPRHDGKKCCCGGKFMDAEDFRDHLPCSAMGPQILTPRHALQTLGTEWGRYCYEDVWVDIAIRTAQKLLGGDVGVPEEYDRQRGLIYAGNYNPPKGVVISDVRFPNEVAAVKKAGGVIWKINRPGAGLEGAAGSHLSEKGDLKLGEVDHEINNTGTLEEFRSMVVGVMKHMIGIGPSVTFRTTL